MEDLLTQQIEALGVVAPYCSKIEKAIDNVIGELSGKRMDDTDVYINSIQNGLNWIIEVYNGTRDLINKDSVVIEKNSVNEAIKRMNDATKAKDDAALAAAFGDVKNFVRTFRETAEKLSAK